MKNKISVVSLCLLLVIAGVVIFDTARQPQPGEDISSRAAQTGNHSQTQIANFEHDVTLGAKQVKIVDDTGTQVTAFGSPSTIATHRSPEDFTATFASGTTLTLASLPSAITDDSQIVYIRVVPTTGDAEVYVNGSGGVTFREAANVVTIAGAGTAPFVTGDAYEVGINLQDKAYDDTNDLVKVQDQSPVWDRRTDAVELIVAAQELDATFTDLGSEIDMRGYKHLALFAVVDIGTSTNVEFRVLHKWESGGTEEFRTINTATVGSNLSLLDLYDYQVNADADQSFKLEISTDGTTPYIQLQVRDSADGDGQIDAAYAVKSY